MPVLKCIARYKSRKGDFKPGQEIEVSEAEADFFQADSPGSFSVIGKQVSSPPINKMVNAPDKAKSNDGARTSPGMPLSTQHAVADPGAFNVAELKALNFSLEEWKLMLRTEQRGKNRVKAVSMIEEKIKELEDAKSET